MLCLEKRRYLPFFKSDNNSVQHFLLASHNTSSFLCKPSKTETYAHVSNKDRLRVIHISDDEECEQRSILTLRNTPTPQFPPDFLVLCESETFQIFFEDESGRSSSLITEIKVQNTAKHLHTQKHLLITLKLHAITMFENLTLSLIFGQFQTLWLCGTFLKNSFSNNILIDSFVPFYSSLLR